MHDMAYILDLIPPIDPSCSFFHAIRVTLAPLAVTSLITSSASTGSSHAVRLQLLHASATGSLSRTTSGVTSESAALHVNDSESEN